MALGLRDDGTLQTPPAAFPAGWFTGAPTPGQIGPAIIVGHVRFGTPGVFENLGDLSRGDRVVVTSYFRGIAKGSVIETEMGLGQIWTMRDGAGVRCEHFLSGDEALEAAGLRE